MNHLNTSRLAPLQCRMGTNTKTDPESFTGSWNLPEFWFFHQRCLSELLPPLLRWPLFHKMWLCRALSTATISKVPQDTLWASLLLSPTCKAQKAELREPTSPQVHTTKNSSFTLPQPVWQCSLMDLVQSNHRFLLQLLIQLVPVTELQGNPLV